MCRLPGCATNNGAANRIEKSCDNSAPPENRASIPLTCSRTYSPTATCWKPHRRYLHADIPPELVHWLLDPASLTLYVSLEPCPMCLSRLKLAGVGRVRYLASDAAGGMVHLHDRLPPIWRLLNPDQDFDQANVSPALSRLAVRLFQVNLRSLRRRLLNRVHPGR